MGVLDTAPGPLFDLIARTASRACGVPSALGVEEAPHDIAFCAHAIGGIAWFELHGRRRSQRTPGRLVERVVYTTTIYRHVLNRGGRGVRSPFD